MNAVETNKLTRAFGSLVAVDELTLTIPEGTVFGFLGPNGAGKTTTVRMLSALIAPTRGTATVAGHRLGENNEAIRQSIGILTETPGLYDRLSAWQNLMFFAQLYDLSAERAASQVERYLRMLELWERRDEKVGGFSKGMRQKLAVARALLHDPQVIFLDEPTSGLDPEAARVVLDFIKALRAEGRTIFLTTHNLPEADELCDLIGVFRVQLLRLGTPAQLRAGMFGSGSQVQVVGDAAHWLETVRTLPFVQDATASESTVAKKYHYRIHARRHNNSGSFSCKQASHCWLGAGNSSIAPFAVYGKGLSLKTSDRCTQCTLTIAHTRRRPRSVVDSIRFQETVSNPKWVNWQLGCKQEGKVRESEERAEEEKAGDGKTSARGFAAFDEVRGAGTRADHQSHERASGYGEASQSAACGGSREVAHESLAGGRLEPGGRDQGSQALQPARARRLVDCRRSWT
jgi:ABC-2 type transport system ATP-binding protein